MTPIDCAHEWSYNPQLGVPLRIGWSNCPKCQRVKDPHGNLYRVERRS